MIGANDASLILYGGVPSRSNVVHWMLEEVGEPYHYDVLDLQNGGQKTPEYLAINPMGKVPALAHNGVVITESAAICAYLADAFPDKRLAPPIGDARRGPYLKWLFFGPSCVEPAVIDKMLGRTESLQSGSIGWGSYDLVIDVLARGVSAGRYLLGDSFSAADVVIASGISWGMMTKSLPDKSEFKDYVARCTERPACRRYQLDVAKRMSDKPRASAS